MQPVVKEGPNQKLNMGEIIKYYLSLVIKSAHLARALKIFNKLHTPAMLEKHAWGGSFDGYRRERWYSFVSNPCRPYKTLQEAFENWHIVEERSMGIDKKTGDFFIRGFFEAKLAQQDFLLEQLAPVLEDTRIDVFGRDECNFFSWIVEDHKFRREEPVYSNIEGEDEGDDDDDDDDVDDDEDEEDASSDEEEVAEAVDDA